MSLNKEIKPLYSIGLRANPPQNKQKKNNKKKNTKQRQ